MATNNAINDSSDAFSVTGTCSAATLATTTAASYTSINGKTITMAGSDAAVGLTITPKGAAAGLTISAGGLTVTAGGVTVTAGNISTASGTLSASTTVTAGTNLVATAGNLLLPTSSSTVGQIQINSVRAFHSFGTDNLFIGSGSGNFTTSGSGRNVGVGYNTLDALTTGSGNLAFGYQCLSSATASSNCIAIGSNALRVNDGSYNVAIGTASFYTATGAASNTAIGFYTGFYITTGARNILIGGFYDGANKGSGVNYTSTESDNFLIGNTGTVGESHKLRIGMATGTGSWELDAAFICGIYNTAVGAIAGVVLSDSANKLGGLAGAAGQVLMGGTKPAFSTATYPATITSGTILRASAANVISGTTATYPDTIATGEILHGSAANVISALGVGTSGYYLMSNGAGSVPTWEASAPGDVDTVSGANGITITGTAADPIVNISGYVANATWTPTISFAGGTTGITYGTQEGRYSRMADIVFFKALVILTSKGSSTGSLRLESLPVAPAIGSIPCTALLSEVTFTGETLIGYVSASNYIVFYYAGNSSEAATAITDAECENTTTIRASGFYWV